MAAPKVRVGGVWTGREARARESGAWKRRDVPLITETFTGSTDGSPWPTARWIPGKTPTGAGQTVSGGSGLLTIGDGTAYDGARAVSIRSTLQRADLDATLTMTFPDDDQTGVDIVVRSDDATNLVSGNCIMLQARRTKHSIQNVVNWNYVDLGTVSGLWLTAGTPYKVRAQVRGNLARLKVWPAANTEPATWDVASGAVTRQAVGHWGLYVPAGGNTTAESVTIDDVTVRAPHVRDKYREPFASTSIWNTPIGTGAVYVPLALEPPAVYACSTHYIVHDAAAPLRSLVQRSYYYPYTDGAAVGGTDTGIQVHWPDDYLVPAPPEGAAPDRPSSAITAAGTNREFQYTVRPAAGTNISIYESPRAEMSFEGDGQTFISGSMGGHGGSGLTGLGGTLRRGELDSPDPIRHVLSCTFNLTRYGTQQGGNITNGYRWPALWADSRYAETSPPGYGSIAGVTPRDGLGEGSLLAIPANVDLAGLALESMSGQKLAWTLQRYGMYVADNTGETDTWNAFQINAEVGCEQENPEIDTSSTGRDTPFGRDMDKIYARLAVVSNNGPSTVGGGGVPLEAALPALD